MENFSMILLFLVFACVNSLPIDDTNNLRFSRANSHHINLNASYAQDLEDTISKQQQSSNAIGRNLDLQRQSAEPENPSSLSNVGVSSIVRVAAQVGIQSVQPAIQPAPAQPSLPVQSSQSAIRADEQINKDRVQERNQVPNQRPAEIPAVQEKRQESDQPKPVEIPVRVEPQNPQIGQQEPVRVEAQSQRNEQSSPVRVDEQVVAVPAAPVRIEPQSSQVEAKAPVRAEEQNQVRGQEPVRVEQPVVVKEPVVVRVDGQSEVKAAPEPVRVEGQTQVGSQIIPVGVIGQQSEVIAPQPVKVEGQIVQEIVAPVVLVERPNQIVGQSPVAQPVLLEAIPNQQQDSRPVPVGVELRAPEPIQVVAQQSQIVGEVPAAPVAPILVDGELVKVVDSVAPVEAQAPVIVSDGQRSD